MKESELQRRVRVEREDRNKWIAEQVRTGAIIPAKMDMSQSWWPARPAIKKDKREIARLYGVEKL
jgi:hypothetical protein